MLVGGRLRPGAVVVWSTLSVDPLSSRFQTVAARYGWHSKETIHPINRTGRPSVPSSSRPATDHRSIWRMSERASDRSSFSIMEETSCFLLKLSDVVFPTLTVTCCLNGCLPVSLNKRKGPTLSCWISEIYSSFASWLLRHRTFKRCSFPVWRFRICTQISYLLVDAEGESRTDLTTLVVVNHGKSTPQRPRYPLRS